MTYYRCILSRINLLFFLALAFPFLSFPSLRLRLLPLCHHEGRRGSRVPHRRANQLSLLLISHTTFLQPSALVPAPVQPSLEPRFRRSVLSRTLTSLRCRSLFKRKSQEKKKRYVSSNLTVSKLITVRRPVHLHRYHCLIYAPRTYGTFDAL